MERREVEQGVKECACPYSIPNDAHARMHTCTQKQHSRIDMGIIVVLLLHRLVILVFALSSCCSFIFLCLPFIFFPLLCSKLQLEEELAEAKAGLRKWKDEASAEKSAAERYQQHNTTLEQAVADLETRLQEQLQLSERQREMSSGESSSDKGNDVELDRQQGPDSEMHNDAQKAQDGAGVGDADGTTTEDSLSLASSSTSTSTPPVTATSKASDVDQSLADSTDADGDTSADAAAQRIRSLTRQNENLKKDLEQSEEYLEQQRTDCRAMRKELRDAQIQLRVLEETVKAKEELISKLRERRRATIGAEKKD
eukprot:m.287149 g.287149  ORF g.287149 m.287149 type:complete len:312 (+) comp15787_c4_seq6:60-995(+)